MASTTASNDAAKSSFGQTLHFITDIKLQELETQRLSYQTHSKVLDEAKAVGEKGDILKRVELLAKAVRSWSGSGSVRTTKTVGGKLHLGDLEFWLEQAKKDPSFSREFAAGWADTLEQHIRHTALRFDAAKLFGTLFNEWLSSGDSSALTYQPEAEAVEGVDEVSDTASEFVDVGRKEAHEQKAKLESIIYDDHPVDKEKLKSYLEKLFESDEATRSLERLRKDLHDFGYYLKRKAISKQDVEVTIKGLLSTGLMDEEKRTTLKAFQENPTVLDEVTSVLNMRMASLKTWSWPKEGILIEFRRHLNGKYRAFTDPEIIDALLLHYIGVAWQVKLKASLRRIFDSDTWVRSTRYTPPNDSRGGVRGRGRGRAPLAAPGRIDVAQHSVKQRKIDQLGGDDGTNSIETERNNTRRSKFFLSQFHDEASKVSAYDDIVDAPERSASDGASPAEIKRELLHIMTTECYLNKAIHGSHAVVCSDLEWFGPSLPHTSILTVLEFMGMSKTWLGFYNAFLAAPVRFPGDAEARVRKRGTPISYSLSVVCGEILLFMMDFAVNQRAKGLYLYRMHDDLWIWDWDAKKVADGWSEMNTLASLVGLTFNQKKTGSAYVGPNSADAKRLPAGDIRWGFLKFDPEQSRFSIDQKDVDLHISEMRRQLASTKSVFGWVNAYNKYMAFYMRNFGGLPANCVGKQHVAEMIDTFARIQRELFPESEGGAVGYLRKTIETRFGTTDLPEGYFYFPISSGGLELRNTMLEVLALERRDHPLATFEDKEDAKDDDDDERPTRSSQDEDELDEEDDDDDSDSDARSLILDIDEEVGFKDDRNVGDQKFIKRAEFDKKAYAELKKVWDLAADNRQLRMIYHTGESDEFMSFDDYCALRESWLASWGTSYRHMLETASIREVTLVPKVRELTEHGAGGRAWYEMDWYEKWVVSIYGEEVVNKFGGLEAVDPNLIPIGMVQLFRTSRMKLDQ